MKEASYENGLLNGLVRTYDANSTLIEEEKFEEGHKIAMKIERNKAGQKEWEAMYMHAQLVIDNRSRLVERQARNLQGRGRRREARTGNRMAPQRPDASAGCVRPRSS